MITWERARHAHCISHLANTLKHRKMIKENAVLNRIRLEYKRVSQFLTEIEMHFDGFLKQDNAE